MLLCNHSGSLEKRCTKPENNYLVGISHFKKLGVVKKKDVGDAVVNKN